MSWKYEIQYISTFRDSDTRAAVRPRLTVHLLDVDFSPRKRLNELAIAGWTCFGAQATDELDRCVAALLAALSGCIVSCLSELQSAGSKAAYGAVR